MSYDSLDESLLSAYLDGELSETETEYVEQALEHSASLRQLLEELRLVRRLVVDAVLHAASVDEASGPATASSDPSFPTLKSKPSSGESFGSPAPWLVDRRHPASQSPSAASEEKTSSASVGETALAKVELPTATWWTARNLAMAVSALAASWLVGLLVYSGREKTSMPMASQSDSQMSARDAAPAVRGRSSESETDPTQSRSGIREESGLTQLSTSGVGLPEENTEDYSLSEHRGLQEGALGLRKDWRPVPPSTEPQDLRFTHPATPFGVDPAAVGAVATEAPSAAALSKASPPVGGMAGGGSPSMPPNPRLLEEQGDQVLKDGSIALAADHDEDMLSNPREVGDATVAESVNLKRYSIAPETYRLDSLSEIEELARHEEVSSENQFSKNEQVRSELRQLASREYVQGRFDEDVRERLLQVEAFLAQSRALARVDVEERDATAVPRSESDDNSNATPSPQDAPRTLFFGYLPSDNPEAKQGTWAVGRALLPRNSPTSFFSEETNWYELSLSAAGAPPASGDASTGTGTPELEFDFVGTELWTAMTATTSGAWLLFIFRESDSEPALQALRQLGVQWEGMENNRDPLVLLQAKRTPATIADVELGHESLPVEAGLLAPGSWDTRNVPALDLAGKYHTDRFGAQVPVDLSDREIELRATKVEPSEPVRMRAVAIYLVPASQPKSNPE